MKILSKKEKEQILYRIAEAYGIKSINGILIESGDEKIRLFTGNLTLEELNKIRFNVRTEVIGIYLAKKDRQNIRMGFDSLSLFRREIEKNAVEISNEDAKKWSNGEEINTSAENESEEFVIIINNGNLLGSGKIKDGKIKNFVPKERRTNC